MESQLDRAKINQAGEDILADSKKIFDSLEKIRGLIEGSKSYFDSPAGDELRSKFKASSDKFTEFKTFLESYGEFCKNFSGNVQKFEDAVTEAVQSIPNI